MHGDTTPENYPLASVLYTTLLSLIGYQKQKQTNKTKQRKPQATRGTKADSLERRSMGEGQERVNMTKIRKCHNEPRYSICLMHA